MALVHLVGAALAMYALARVAGARPAPALVAPALFVLNAHTGWRVGNGVVGQIMALLWTPTAAALALAGLRRRSVLLMALAGAALAMLVLAGTVYDQYFAGLAVAALVISDSVARLWRSSRRQWLSEAARNGVLAAVAVVVMVGVSAVKLLPVTSYQPFSTRMGFSLQEAEVGLDSIPTAGQFAGIVLEQVPASFLPGMNFLAVVVAAAALVRPNRTVSAFLGMAVAGMWTTLGQRAPLDLYAFFHGALPGFAFNNTTLRFMNLFYLAVAGLAALGLSTLVDLAAARLRSSSGRVSTGAALGIAALIWTAAVPPMRPVVEQATSADAYPQRPLAGSAPDILAKFQAAEGEHAFRTFSTYIFDRGPDRVNAAASSLYGLDLVNPINAHLVPSYALMPDYSATGETLRRQYLLSAILNARYAVYERAYRLDPPPAGSLVAELQGGVISRNLEARPRAALLPSAILLIGADRDRDFNAFEARLVVFLAAFDPQLVTVFHGGSQYVDDYSADELASFAGIVLGDWQARDGSTARKLLDDYRTSGGMVIDFEYIETLERNPFRRASAFLADRDPPKRLTAVAEARTRELLRRLARPGTSGGHGAVEIVSYEPTKMEFRTPSLERPTALVFSQTYFPGWTVDIDGQPAKLFMADSLVNGVMVAAGPPHFVTFRFQPGTFVAGAWISSLSAAAVLITAGVSVWRGRPSRAR